MAKRPYESVMPERGVTFIGAHHETYLSDLRRTPRQN